MKIAATLDRLKLAGDGVSYLSSGKSVTDHAISKIMDADCNMLNVVTPRSVCAPTRNASAEKLNTRVNMAAVRDDLTNAQTFATSSLPAEDIAAVSAEAATDEPATDL